MTVNHVTVLPVNANDAVAPARRSIEYERPNALGDDTVRHP